MKRFHTIFLFLTIFPFILPPLSLAGQFKVIEVSDGDTLLAFGHDIVIRVRLIGIDAPEAAYGKRIPGQPYSRQAGEYLAGLILNKVVDIKGYATGSFPYSYLVGEIYVNGKNMNIAMIQWKNDR